MKVKYNYQVIFGGKQSKGNAKFMTESQARAFATHILSCSKLLDLVIQVKRLTPEPTKYPYTWTNPSTTINDTNSINWTGNFNNDGV